MTIVVETWQLWAYAGLVMATAITIAWIFHSSGRHSGLSQGRMEGIQQERKRLRDAVVATPRSFLQTNKEGDSQGKGRIGRARVVPRRQVTPPPRRHKPKKEQ